MVRPLLGGNGWHRVQYGLENAYCGEDPGRMYLAILKPGARRVTENHRAGALFTDLLRRGDAGDAMAWLQAQLDGAFQGSEQGGGYTNYYRADVLAGLRWASEHGDAALARLAASWLRRSYALDLLHTAPRGYEVTMPCSRNKLYNRDGRSMSLKLLAGEADPRQVLAARRWQYPAYDDVRWLADALLAGRLQVDADAAAWARRRERPALERIVGELRGMRLHSPLRWVLLEGGGWYSYAPGGILDSPGIPIDAVAVTAAGVVSELAQPRGRGPVALRAEKGHLAPTLATGGRVLELPPGRPLLTVEVGSGDPAGSVP